jgi:hypothetical protein
VTSGYYRNHLYVLLGLNVLATLIALGAPDQFSIGPPLVAAIASYVGSVAWLYEKPRAGIVLLLFVAGADLWGTWAGFGPSQAHAAATVLGLLDSATSGLLLGFTMAAMFLGHWYLNSPTMAIEPLLRLVGLVAAASVLRAAVEAAGLARGISVAGWPDPQTWMFIALRWLSGILGALVLMVMTWRTLKIPNTQSATGLLYVAVIVTFLGELVALILGGPPAA